MTRYVVRDEVVLGYIKPGMLQGLMGVLAVDGRYYGVSPLAGYCAADERWDDLRDATVADFERFRVLPPPDWKG